MSSIAEKLFQRIKHNPKDVRFHDQIYPLKGSKEKGINLFTTFLKIEKGPLGPKVRIDSSPEMRVGWRRITS